MILHRSDAKLVQVLPGLSRRTLVHGPSLMIVEFSLVAGSDLPVHTHPHEQAGYIVSGHIRLNIAGEVHELKAGDSYHVLPNVPHGAHIVESAIVVDTFTPPRQDYV